MLYSEEVTALLNTASLNSLPFFLSSSDMSAAPPDLRATSRHAAGLCDRNHVHDETCCDVSAMSPSGVVVPFSVFTDYRNRRSSGAIIAPAGPAAADEPPRSPDESGCTDAAFPSAETTPRAEAEKERIPS
jgi:hypothetical protein